MESDLNRTSLVLSVSASFEKTVNDAAKERAGSIHSARLSVTARDGTTPRAGSAAPSRTRGRGRGGDGGGRTLNKVHEAVASDPDDELTSGWLSLNTSTDLGNSQERSQLEVGGGARVFASTKGGLSPTAPSVGSPVGTSGASLRNSLPHGEATPATGTTAGAPQQGRCPSAATTAKRVAEARQRVLDSRMQDIALKAQQLEDSKLRLAEADERRALIGDQHVVQRSLCWASAVWIGIAAKTLMASVSAARASREELRGLRLFPHLVARIRRPLRRARLRLCQSQAAASGAPLQKPTIAQLRFDKMLTLFSDGHLQHVIDHLELRYYFEHETVIFMGSEDDEGYVLCQGAADVMMGKTCVFTMRAGMAFGTVGMISGEPRTASIVARTSPCLVWAYTRSTFDAYQSSSNDRRTLAEAHKIIAELRESNMRNVYKGLLQPTFLRTFPTLKSVDDATLSALATAGTPKVIKAGSTVYCAKKIPLSAAPHLLLLRGTFRFSFESLEHRAAMLAPHAATDHQDDDGAIGHHHHHSHSTSHGMSLTEQVMRFVELPLRHAVHEERTIVRLVAQIVENYAQPTAQPAAAEEVGSLDQCKRRGSAVGSSSTAATVPTTATASTTTKRRSSLFPDAAPSASSPGKAHNGNSPTRAGGHLPIAGQCSDDISGGNVSSSSIANSVYHRTRTDCFFMDLRGPLLLNMATIFLQEHHSPFVVQSLGDCDVMSFSKEVVLAQDVLELAVIRQNAYNLHCPFMPALPRAVLLRALFQKGSGGAAVGAPPSASAASMAADAALIKFLHARIAQGSLPQTRWVYGKNDFVNFGVADDGGMAFLVVLAGAIDHKKQPKDGTRGPVPFVRPDSGGGAGGTGGRGGGELHVNIGSPVNYQPPSSFRGGNDPQQQLHDNHQPFVWPSLPLIYFGCTDVVSRVVSTRLDVVKIRRSDLIKLLVRELDEAMLTELVGRLAQGYVDECGGRRPTFSELDIEELFVSGSGTNSSCALKVGGPALAFSHTRGGASSNYNKPTTGHHPINLREVNAAAIRLASTSTLSTPTVPPQGLLFPPPTPKTTTSNTGTTGVNCEKKPHPSPRISEASRHSSSNNRDGCGLMSIMDAPDFDSIDAIDAFGEGPVHQKKPSAPSGVSPTSKNPRRSAPRDRQAPRSNSSNHERRAPHPSTPVHTKPSVSTVAGGSRRAGDAPQRSSGRSSTGHGQSLPLRPSDFVRSSPPKTRRHPPTPQQLIEHTPPPTTVFSGSSSVSSSMAEEDLLAQMRSLRSHRLSTGSRPSSSVASSRSSSTTSSACHREYHAPVTHRVRRPDRRAEREARRQQLSGSPPSTAMRAVSERHAEQHRQTHGVVAAEATGRNSLPASSHHNTSVVSSSVSFNEHDAMFGFDDESTPSEFRSTESTPRQGSTVSRHSSSSITAQHRQNIERMVQTRYEKIAEFVALASSSERD